MTNHCINLTNKHRAAASFRFYNTVGVIHHVCSVTVPNFDVFCYDKKTKKSVKLYIFYHKKIFLITCAI